MSFNSIFDNYYNLIKVDKDYYRNWLTQYGTECKLLIPRVDDVGRVDDIYTSYGAQTYSSNSINYETKIIHLLIQPEDFNKVENDIEATIRVISPVTLDDGNLIEFRKLNKWYTFEVRSPIEVYWGMYYRTTLYLNRVREVDNE